MARFPAKEVQRITGVTRDPRTGMAHISITASDLRQLIAAGAASPDGNQNASPSIGEFLDRLGNDPRVRFHGFVVWPPRRDARVTIEGFEGTGYSAVEAEQLRQAFGLDWSADEVEITERLFGGHYVRFWWD